MSGRQPVDNVSFGGFLVTEVVREGESLCVNRPVEVREGGRQRSRLSVTEGSRREDVVPVFSSVSCPSETPGPCDSEGGVGFVGGGHCSGVILPPVSSHFPSPIVKGVVWARPVVRVVECFPCGGWGKGTPSPRWFTGRVRP